MEKDDLFLLLYNNLTIELHKEHYNRKYDVGLEVSILFDGNEVCSAIVEIGDEY